MMTDKEAWSLAEEATLISAADVVVDEPSAEIIGPKVHEYQAQKRHIRHSYCSQRDRLQKRHADEIFKFYSRLQLRPMDKERLRCLSWKFTDWQSARTWKLLWMNIQIVCVVLFVAFVPWIQDFWLEYVRGYWMRRRQRLESQELYQNHDEELWELSTSFAERYGWDAIEDDTGFSLRPEPLHVALKREEWW